VSWNRFPGHLAGSPSLWSWSPRTGSDTAVTALLAAPGALLSSPQLVVVVRETAGGVGCPATAIGAASRDRLGRLGRFSRPVAAPSLACGRHGRALDLLALSQPVPPEARPQWWGRPDSHAPSGSFQPIPPNTGNVARTCAANQHRACTLICPLVLLSTTVAQTRRARLLALGVAWHVTPTLPAFELERSRRVGDWWALTSQVERFPNSAFRFEAAIGCCWAEKPMDCLRTVGSWPTCGLTIPMTGIGALGAEGVAAESPRSQRPLPCFEALPPAGDPIRRLPTLR